MTAREEASERAPATIASLMDHWAHREKIPLQGAIIAHGVRVGEGERGKVEKKNEVRTYRAGGDNNTGMRTEDNYDNCRRGS